MGKRLLFSFLILLACKGSLFASHIVGGEFELLHIQDFRYQINMILYFDEKNGAIGAQDPSATVYIYRKSDNQLMLSVFLPLRSIGDVPYSNPSCTSDILETTRILYNTNLVFPPEDFNDPEGYYISYERCCRNYGISNIFSNDPNSGVGGVSAGQTFYLEFPPVVDENGNPFVNSSPRLFPPLRDYGCVGKYFYTDFGGIDDDGDSLVYTMVTPYSTFDTQNAIPAFPSPGPYPDVVWRSNQGFGENNIIQGNPDLRISKDGLLTARPEVTGLFVFAVQCEEYRDGKRIGLMRRDFQMLVVDGCINETPQVRARPVGSSDFYEEGDILNFQYTEENKCIEILVQDIPVGGDLVENVNITAIPINFDASLEGISINIDQNVPLTGIDDVAIFTLCFPDCPYLPDRPYEIGIIALDDACPLPALDTIIVSVRVQPPPNYKPYFEGLSSVLNVNVTEQAGGVYERTIVVRDPENDPIELGIFPFGFDLAAYGMRFENIRNEDGRIETRFIWEYDCQTVDFADKSDFTIQLVANDIEECNLPVPSFLTMKLNITLPPNTAPTIFSSQSSSSIDYLKLRYPLDRPISLNILARDEDNDEIILTGSPLNFAFNQVNASFPGAQGPGLSNVTSEFNMTLDCEYNLAEQDSFRVAFFVEDFDKCRITNRDTLMVDFIIDPPISTAPLLTYRSLTNTEIVNDQVTTSVGEEIRIRLTGIDFDNDNMTLRLVSFDPRLEGRFIFDDVTGTSRINSELTYIPECGDFPPGALEASYLFTFELVDDNCYVSGNEQVELEIVLEDIIRNQDTFLPPNVFTPNGDPYNPYFALEGMNENNEPINTGLPLDNCESRFEYIAIFNRWGTLVYRSEDRNFKWNGQNVPPGIYYYSISYSDWEYKGSLTVIY